MDWWRLREALEESSCGGGLRGSGGGKGCEVNVALGLCCCCQDADGS